MHESWDMCHASGAVAGTGQVTGVQRQPPANHAGSKAAGRSARHDGVEEEAAGKAMA